MERFDLVVIGSGPAGEKGAAQAAYFGKSVALVERLADPGGVSVHTGTLPSKTLRESALYLTGFRRRELYGMTLRLDRQKSLRQLTGRLRDVTAAQTRQIKRNFERHRITTITGRARFLDAATIGVFDGDGVETRRLGFDAALVAVGSSPLPPRGLTFDDPDVEDSDRVLDLDRIPKSLAVVGGGVIGCEYASLFAALGTRVTLIEGRDRLLGFLDGEVSSTLKIALERMGGEVLLGDAVETITRVANLPANALRLTSEIRARARRGQGAVLGRAPRQHGRARTGTGGRGLRREGADPGQRPLPDERAPDLRRRGRRRLSGARRDVDGAGARRRVPRLRHSLQDRRGPALSVRGLHDPGGVHDRRHGGGAEGAGRSRTRSAARATRTTRGARSRATWTAS